jgi:hypothetical protein
MKAMEMEERHSNFETSRESDGYGWIDEPNVQNMKRKSA